MTRSVTAISTKLAWSKVSTIRNNHWFAAVSAHIHICWVISSLTSCSGSESVTISPPIRTTSTITFDEESPLSEGRKSDAQCQFHCVRSNFGPWQFYLRSTLRVPH
jgi:hypothetical protein